jgi:hypothetical protein
MLGAHQRASRAQLHSAQTVHSVARFSSPTHRRQGRVIVIRQGLVAVIETERNVANIDNQLGRKVPLRARTGQKVAA